MARLRTQKADMSVESDLTPLIDCIFLLLIFIICTTEITKSVNDQLLILPYAAKATLDDLPKERIVINVYPSDKLITNDDIKSGGEDAPDNSIVTIEGKGYNWPGLEKYLQSRAKVSTKEVAVQAGGREVNDMPVKIRGHRTTPFKDVQFVLVGCIKYGYWKISFGTFNPMDFVVPATKHFPEYVKDATKWQPDYLQRVFSAEEYRKLNNLLSDKQ